MGLDLRDDGEDIPREVPKRAESADVAGGWDDLPGTVQVADETNVTDANRSDEDSSWDGHAVDVQPTPSQNTAIDTGPDSNDGWDHLPGGDSAVPDSSADSPEVVPEADIQGDVLAAPGSENSADDVREEDDGWDTALGVEHVGKAADAPPESETSDPTSDFLDHRWETGPRTDRPADAPERPAPDAHVPADAVPGDGWGLPPVPDVGNPSADEVAEQPATAMETPEDFREQAVEDARQAVQDAQDTSPQGAADFASEPAPVNDDVAPNDLRAEHRNIRDSVEGSDAHKAESLNDAKDYAEGLGIQYVDYKGFDQETANETNATLEALLDRYPEVGGLRSLGTIQARDAELMARHSKDMGPVSDSTIAETAPPTFGVYSGIAVNELWAGDSKASEADLQRQRLRQDHPPGLDSMSGVIAHEFGHVVYNDIEQAGDGKDVLGVSSEVYDNGRDWVRANISSYGTVSERECFAEAFAEYHLSPQPREAALRVGEAVDDYYRRRV